MFKNVATKIALFAFDTTTGVAKTGDSANITAYVAKDYGAVTVLADTTATEMDSTNAKGWYLFDVAQAESNADSLLFTAKSSTANISVVGQYIFTTPNRFTTLVIDAAGLADANAVKIGPTGAGTAQTARDLGTSVLLSSGTGTGQISLTSGLVTLAGVTHTGAVIPTVTTTTTATNLTNAPTAGDFTATMKTSIGTAVAASAVASVTGNVGGNVVGSVASVTARVTANTDQLAGQTVTAAAGVTFPTSVASPTNITAGTITTATSVTNGVTVTTNNDKTGYTIASGGIGSGAHAAAELNNIADATLDRNMATGTDSGTDSTVVRTMRQALRSLRNKVSISGGALTVTKEDDATTSWTGSVTTTAGNPISTVDPT